MTTTTAAEPRWLSAHEQHAWRAYLRGSRLLEAALDRDLQSHGVQLSEYEIISMLLATTTGDQQAVTRGVILAAAYCLGLGVPFLLIAAVYDRAPGLIRPLVRHGRLVSIIGGALVVLIGVAMLFDWLALLPQFVPFNTQI